MKAKILQNTSLPGMVCIEAEGPAEIVFLCNFCEHHMKPGWGLWLAGYGGNPAEGRFSASLQMRKLPSRTVPVETKPAPHLPPLPESDFGPLEGHYGFSHSMVRQIQIAAYASAFSDRADMLKTICEQQDEIKALREREEAHAEAKRAPMTRYQADVLLCKAVQEECHGHLNWSAACSAIMAASNGLTEEQCRALVPPELTYEDSVDGLSYSDGHSDGLKDGHNACCYDMHEAITAAFHPKGEGK